MVFCKDCKHSKDVDRGPYGLICESPNNSVQHVAVERYLVSGIEQPVINAMRGANCLALRLARPPEVEELVCGPDGKWFEARK